MHHSEEENRFVFGLGATQYFDDSGSDGGSPVVCIGGPVLSRIKFRMLSQEWGEILRENEIESPLHMSDFFGGGKYVGRRPEFNKALSHDIVRLVKKYKEYSISVTLSQQEFTSLIPRELQRELIGPYAFSFIAAVMCNRIILEERNPTGKISYMIDAGYGRQDQLVAAHRLIQAVELERSEHFTGNFAVDRDDNVAALQAADVVSWTARRASIGPLHRGFEPLLGLLNEEHRHVKISLDGWHIRAIADDIHKWINENGATPHLKDVLVWQINA